MSTLLLSVCTNTDHRIVFQCTIYDVPEDYRFKVPLVMINDAIEMAAARLQEKIDPILGQYTYTEYNPLRNIIHCKIYCYVGV